MAQAPSLTLSILTLALALPASQAAAQDDQQDQAHPSIKLEMSGEPPAGVFSIGAGFDHHEQFIASAGLSHGRLFGAEGLSLALDASLSAMASRVDLNLGAAPDLIDPLFFELNAHSHDLLLSPDHPLSALRNGTLARVGLKLDRNTSISLGHRFDLDQVDDGGQALVGGPDFVRRDSAMTTSALSVRLDYLSNPDDEGPMLDGLRLSAQIERTFEGLGSDSRFTRFEASAALGVPLSFGFHLQLNGRAGAIRAPSGADVPLLDRFKLGVAHGFGGDLLAPTGPTLDPGGANIPLGGTEAAVGNATLTIPLFPDVGLSLFGGVEAGAVRDPLDGVGTDFNTSAFGGLRWLSPIGQLSFGFSAPIEGDMFQKEPAFYFMLGL